jgi:hypothetical protein
MVGSGMIIERLIRSLPMSVGARWELNQIAAILHMAKPVPASGKNSAACAMTRGAQRGS